MRGRTWRGVEVFKAEEIKKYLLDHGGVEEEVKSANEIWRIRFSDSTFIYYKSGTIYSTPSSSSDPTVLTIWEHINSTIGSIYVLPTKEFLIGLDETGKGEVIGHTVLTGVIFPKKIFNELDLVVGPANTKKRHRFEYWDDLYRRLDSFRSSGLDFITETIPPWIVDRFNLNKIMDIVYQRILSIFFRRTEVSKCRIVLDDYGLGHTLRRFFGFLRKRGAEIIVTHNADGNYLEAKTASLISKRTREEVIKRINENPEYQVDGLTVGFGNAGDVRTVNWLKRWYSSYREWPWFVKKSFKIIREIEGKSKPVKKMTPPIRENLLSKKFISEFNRGKLSIRSLSIVCPHCGEINKAVTFAVYRDKETGKKISGMKCPSCKKMIDDAGITLRYYCGYAVPDSNIIRRGLISKDLESQRFFEDFTIVIPAVVKRECDVRHGKKEFEKLARYASMGRIKLEFAGKAEEIPDKLPSDQRDEMIANISLKYNAILITADNTMKAYAISKNIFTIFI